MSGFIERISERKSHTDADVERNQNLLIIATEGRVTEYKYFEAVREQYIIDYPDIARSDLAPYEKPDDDSAPEHVVKMLDQIVSEFGAQIEGDDELWVVIDVDNWGEKTLKKVAESCREKGYRLAISNPCFELWLLLHLDSLDVYEEKEADLFLGSKGPGNLKEELKTLVQFNHKNPDFTPFLKNNRVPLAIDRAKQIDTQDENWPHNLGSRVYRIVEKVLA